MFANSSLEYGRGWRVYPVKGTDAIHLSINPDGVANVRDINKICFTVEQIIKSHHHQPLDLNLQNAGAQPSKGLRSDHWQPLLDLLKQLHSPHSISVEGESPGDVPQLLHREQIFEALVHVQNVSKFHCKSVNFSAAGEGITVFLGRCSQLREMCLECCSGDTTPLATALHNSNSLDRLTITNCPKQRRAARWARPFFRIIPLPRPGRDI